jgi:hypothetical protein
VSLLTSSGRQIWPTQSPKIADRPVWRENSSVRVKIGVFQHNRLLAAVSRIAAILPNDLAPTNMNGPMQTLAGLRNAALRLSQSGHSSAAQHSDFLKDCTAGHCQP